MTDPGARRRVLILCTGNSCRSQMAEGFVNHVLGGEWEARSAGTVPAARVNPLAVRVMAEVGVDISAQRPGHVDAMIGQRWDLVVTVCDSAREACPYFPHSGEQIHVGFPDPAEATGSEAERLVIFRQVRDAIRERLLPVVQARGGGGSGEAKP
jgi:arsenate reductase (thioredoxin)